MISSDLVPNRCRGWLVALTNHRCHPSASGTALMGHKQGGEQKVYIPRSDVSTCEKRWFSFSTLAVNFAVKGMLHGELFTTAIVRRLEAGGYPGVAQEEIVSKLLCTQHHPVDELGGEDALWVEFFYGFVTSRIHLHRRSWWSNVSTTSRLIIKRQPLNHGEQLRHRRVLSACFQRDTDFVVPELNQDIHERQQ